ncbi:hypothetical protein [Pseudomonas frederiksbergensis]|uniref:hypothetical protein n=1 Tax=Pseudomonas frederiksbergensis TaxID=104087 RepID=UPI003D227442
MKMPSLTKDGTVIRQYSETSEWQPFSEVVHDVSNSALLRCLDSLLDDEHLLLEAASRSHRHQLGFFKCVLMTNDAGGCLRLHLWDDAITAQEDIHSHCAHFHSRVVFGSLSEKAFDLIPGTSHARFRYHFDATAGHSVAVADGLTGISLLESRVLLAGDAYSKRAKELHNISDVAQGTVTVSAWETRQSEALVLKDFNATSEDCLASLGIPADELRVVLRCIKDRIIAK